MELQFVPNPFLHQGFLSLFFSSCFFFITKQKYGESCTINLIDKHSTLKCSTINTNFNYKFFLYKYGFMPCLRQFKSTVFTGGRQATIKTVIQIQIPKCYMLVIY